MASNPPTLPPSALSNAQANARIDQIAVRIVNLPDGLRNNASSVKIKGSVEGQNQDGSLSIKTDKGEVRILLKDRGNLPTGTKIDIEIPAGRSPQQANIRPSTENTPPSLAQNVADARQKPASQQTQIQSSNPLENNIKLNSDTLGSVITSTQNQVIDDAPIPIPIAGGALQAGQMARLLPIPPGSLPPNVQKLLLTPLPAPELLASLVNVIESTPKDQAQLRSTLIRILSRLDISSLTQNKTGSTNTPATTPPQISNTQLLGKIGTLLQSVELEGNSTIETGVPPRGPQPTPQNFSVFNPSKPVDGQILAFQPTMGQTAHPYQTINGNLTQGSPIAPAQVLGFTDAKLPILSVPLPNTGLTQLYTLQFKADNLTTGTPVFIALDPLATRPTQTLFADSLHPLPALTQWISPTIGSGSWDTIDALLKTLVHHAPAQGQNFAQLIPSPAQPHNMAALSMLFLSMLRTGASIDDWVSSETANLLKQMGKIDLLRAASTDMTLASKIDGMQLPQDWKMTMLPLLWEQNIHRTPLYYKHLPDEGDKNEADAKKRRKLRFLFDLNLSRMGGVQVDGFMQSERLDLILRTKSPLSPPMQSQMKRIYAGAMDKSRLNGDLSFQFKPEHWVDFAKSFEKTGVTA